MRNHEFCIQLVRSEKQDIEVRKKVKNEYLKSRFASKFEEKKIIKKLRARAIGGTFFLESS